MPVQSSPRSPYSDGRGVWLTPEGRAPPHDGADNAHARQACDIAHHFRELDVHLLQRLRDPLHVPSGVLDQAGPMPLLGPPHADRRVGSKGRGQQAEAVQPLDPLAVVDVGLGAVGSTLHLAGIDQ